MFSDTTRFGLSSAALTDLTTFGSEKFIGVLALCAGALFLATLGAATSSTAVTVVVVLFVVVFVILGLGMDERWSLVHEMQEARIPAGVGESVYLSRKERAANQLARNSIILRMRADALRQTTLNAAGG